MECCCCDDGRCHCALRRPPHLGSSSLAYPVMRAALVSLYVSTASCALSSTWLSAFLTSVAPEACIACVPCCFACQRIRTHMCCLPTHFAQTMCWQRGGLTAAASVVGTELATAVLRALLLLRLLCCCLPSLHHLHSHPLHSPPFYPNNHTMQQACTRPEQCLAPCELPDSRQACPTQHRMTGSRAR